MSNSGTLVDLESITSLFAHRVARASDLVGLGLSGRAVYRRCAPGGPWQRLLPGVLMLGNSPPNRHQLVQAALCYAEPDAMLTGRYALLLHGMRATPPPGPVHVLIPKRRQVLSTPLVTVERTTRMPKPVMRQGFLVAPLERALLDSVRHSNRVDEVRAVLAEAVWRKGLAPAVIQAELAAGNSRGTALPRRILTEVIDGVRTNAEGLAGELIRTAGLPPPKWNVRLDDDDADLGPISCWWEDVAMAMDIDAEADQPVPGTVARTLDRHAALTAAGVVVVHASPGRLKRSPKAVVGELRRARDRAARRERPTVTASSQQPQQPRSCGAR